MSNDYVSSRRAHPLASVVVLLLLGFLLALAGNVYQFMKSQHLARDLTAIQHNLQAQITRLSDATSGAFEVTERRFDQLKRLQDSTAAAIIDARSELRRDNSQVATRLEDRNQELAQKNQQLTAQLTALRQDLSARLQNTSTKLDTADAKLQHVSTEAESNRADLKKVAGDLSMVSAKLNSAKPVATFSQPAVAPPLPPARKHLPFDLLTTKVPTRIGEIQIAIRSTDPKNNRYTMDLYTGDKIARGKDCAVNEAVQFYLPGSPLPYEVVVNQVWKDEVIGYVSAPNLSAQASATARNNTSVASTR